MDILGICKTTAYRLVRENRFRSVLIGGKYRISKRSFDAWLDGETKGTGQGRSQDIDPVI